MTLSAWYDWFSSSLSSEVVGVLCAFFVRNSRVHLPPVFGPFMFYDRQRDIAHLDSLMFKFLLAYSKRAFMRISKFKHHSFDL